MKAIAMRVTVVVPHQGNVLVIRERKSSGEQYCLPGGKIEFLETIADAVRREVLEETGLMVEMERMLWVDERIDRAGEGKHTIGIGVLARLTGEKTTPVPEGIEDEQIAWAGWVTPEEWNRLPLESELVRLRVNRVLSGEETAPAYRDSLLDGEA